MRVWCIYQCSSILDSDACVYDAHIYDPRSLILIHACMMHLSMFLDPWLYCMCVWCTYLWSSIPDSDLCVYDAHIYDPRSLILMHVCMMHISMILDLDLEACMYVWCMYLWCGKFCQQRTNEQGDSRSLMRQTFHAWTNLDPDEYIHDAYVHDALMYDASVILNPWLYRMCVWCGWNFVPDGRTYFHWEQQQERTRQF